MKKSIELFNVNIDLQPAKNWRDLAPSGRKSMSYKIFGHAKAEDGSVIAVSASVGAITAEGVIGDLGTAEVPAVSGLLAKNDPRLDTAALTLAAQLAALLDGNSHGQPLAGKRNESAEGTFNM